MVEKVKSKWTLLCLILTLSGSALAQDDLLDMLEEEGDTEKQYTFGTFKTTRIINSQSVDIQPKGELQFLISHRFGDLLEGTDTFWGMDDARIRLGLEYGITSKWAVGAGRGTDDASAPHYDLYSKYKVLRQTEGNEMPVSVVWYTNLTIIDKDYAQRVPTFDYQTKHYLTYVNQLLIARKFSSKTSVQLMPTLIHRNVVLTSNLPHQVYAVGLGLRQKLTNRFSLTAEYYYLASDELKKAVAEPLVLGFEIETGGHVFMFNVGNSRGMTEKILITQAEGDWFGSDPQLFFGFNIARIFNLNRK